MEQEKWRPLSADQYVNSSSADAQDPPLGAHPGAAKEVEHRDGEWSGVGREPVHVDDAAARPDNPCEHTRGDFRTGVTGVMKSGHGAVCAVAAIPRRPGELRTPARQPAVGWPATWTEKRTESAPRDFTSNGVSQ